jgi:hypothetical protein
LTPSLLQLRAVVDRMRSLANVLLLRANMCGELQLGVETDLVKVTTYYGDLAHPQLGKLLHSCKSRLLE